MNALDLLPLTLLLPLVGVGLGVFVRWLPDRWFVKVATALVGVAFAVAAGVVLPAYLRQLDEAPTAISPEGSQSTEHGEAHEGAVHRQVLWRWIAVGEEEDPDRASTGRPAPFSMIVDAELQLDGLSLVMLLIVTGVGFLIHVFSLGYMGHDAGIRRYFTYLNLFIFSMLVLVLGGNFLVLFVGWELVGACSYLLIGYWYQDAANADAGRKAFIVNRVGDFAFLVGLILIWTAFGTLSFAQVLPMAKTVLPLGGWLPLAICACLVFGATGKSAQLPLFVWLPDAMAGPTPVSALIHAATMVTAGVYMVARAQALFEQAPIVLTAVAVIGAATALVAALIAIVQVDIKRTLAYSTVSQLGYMFLALGAGSYFAAIFHLMTHAFFKALLFLGAGSVMHAMEAGFEAAHDHPAPQDGVPAHQDMRAMGGLLGRLPITGWTFLAGGLALAGVVPFAGFWSKDEILYGVLGRSGAQWGVFSFLWLVGLVTAGLTAFYTARQMLLVLSGAPRSAGAAAASESPRSMTVPLLVLAALAVVGGFFGPSLPGVVAPLARLLGPVLGEHEVADALVGKLPAALLALAVAGVGLVAAWLAYGPRPRLDPARITERLRPLYRLAWGKFYLDDVYLAVIVRPFRRLADWLWLRADDVFIDGSLNRAGRAASQLGQALRRTQNGFARRYALSMAVGAVLIFAYLFFGR